MNAPDDRPVVRLSLPEKIDFLEIASQESNLHARRLLNFWSIRGPIKNPVLDAAFRALWKTPINDERQNSG